MGSHMSGVFCKLMQPVDSAWEADEYRGVCASAVCGKCCSLCWHGDAGVAAGTRACCFRPPHRRGHQKLSANPSSSSTPAACSTPPLFLNRYRTSTSTRNASLAPCVQARVGACVCACAVSRVRL